MGSSVGVGVSVGVAIGVSVAAPEPSEPIHPAKASVPSVAAEPKKARREARELVADESSRLDAVWFDFIVVDYDWGENTDEDIPNCDGTAPPLGRYSHPIPAPNASL
jgi:hypothetical protein